MFAEWAFWLAVGFVAYVYFGYPLLLALISAAFRRPVRKAPIEPFISLIVPAYNEERSIEEKILTALDLDYPDDKYEVIVVSDGSSDRTVELAKKHEDGRRVKVIAFQKNRGKISALNEVTPAVQGEIVAYSDASSMPERSSLRMLAENFADPEVGAVSGVYRLSQKDKARLGRQEGVYWKYETFLKLKESEIDSILGCHGSLYAIRKALYPSPAASIINDDYVIPLRILHKGWRVAYEPRAVAFEEAEEMGGFGRRIRVMAGNFEQLAEIRGLLWPPRWMPLLFFISHKIGRLVAPLAMVAAVAANFFLLDQPLYRATLAAQAAFYLLAAVGTSEMLRPKALRLPYYFTMINMAVLFGFYYAFVNRGKLKWKESGRQP